MRGGTINNVMNLDETQCPKSTGSQVQNPVLVRLAKSNYDTWISLEGNMQNLSWFKFTLVELGC